VLKYNKGGERFEKRKGGEREVLGKKLFLAEE
jgi:hypothetical protein